MALYEWKCDCGRDKEVFASMKESGTKVECACGQDMHRIISLPSTDMVNHVRYSSSMGVNPNKIKEMERKYPGSRYTPDGKLTVNSRKDKLNKMRERGLIEFE